MGDKLDWSAYDAAPLIDQVSHIGGSGGREMLLRVHGMHCSSCVGRIEQALASRCRRVQVNLGTGSVELGWDEAAARPSELMQAIADCGFRPEPIDDRPDIRIEQRERRQLLIRVGIAGVLGMQVMMLAATRYTESGTIEPAMELTMRYAQWAMSTPVLVYSGWPILRQALADIRARRFGMDVPISLALLLAYVASGVNLLLQRGHVYYDSVTMFVFLLLLARWFEGRGRALAQQRLRELAGAQPLTASRERGDGSVEQIDSKQLCHGDIVVVPPAVAVPADGRLLSHCAEVDESLLTGEADPAVRRAGEMVMAGSINAGSSALRLQVTAVYTATQLSHIQRLIHQAQQYRPQVQQRADRIARWITVTVLASAIAGAILWWPTGPDVAFEVMLAVLVVTCPCALSLATPAALAAAGSSLASSGVLLTRADALLQLPRVDTVCFDKTGTLTTGQMRCVSVQPADGYSADDCLDMAAALERDIQHPVATAFRDRQPMLKADRVETLAARGVRGWINSASIQLISSEPRDHQAGGLTWLDLIRDGRCIARFGLSHQLRPGARACIEALRAEGLRPVILSGDSASAVATVAETLGITDYRAALKPGDKLALLRRLQTAGSRVWMIGDGINDAPTLAAADVSTSLVSGSALAQTHAALLLTTASLSALPEAYRIAQRTRRIIRQNIAWAALYNVAAIPLALAGSVTPWLAALGMGISSVVVVANALRLSVPSHRVTATTSPDLACA